MFNENIIEKLKTRLSEFRNIKLELQNQEFDASNYYNLMNAAILSVGEKKYTRNMIKILLIAIAIIQKTERACQLLHGAQVNCR